jgi:hypothetical protein
MARAPAKRHNYETRRSGRHRPLTERSSVLARRAGFARLFVSFAANLASQAVVVHNESVKITLETINQMQADGVIEEYAIGGAVGATFYLEPAATLDLDIFVILPATSERVLVNLAPIYEYLKVRGGKVEGEHLVIAGWPVQFLVASGELEEEAVAEAVSTELDGVKTRVMSAEHLAAIALPTGRAKDYIRLTQFLEQGALDRRKLQIVIEKHGLTAKAQRFESKFL